jgi:Ca2+-binding RTX toxin-like protein
MASFTLTSVTSANQTLFGGEIGFIAATGANLGVISMDTSVLVNNGAIFAHDLSAITFTSGGAYIENHGTITGGGSLAVIDAYGGVDFLVRLELNNYGTITASGTYDAAAILANSGGNRIVNHGTIFASKDSAIELYYGVLAVPDFGNIIINDGLIAGADGSAVFISNGSQDIIRNSGRIAGSIELLGGYDFIVNSGAIDGSILFNSGTLNELRNSGEILGNVTFVSGDNTIQISGRITGTLLTYSMNDTIDLRGGIVTGGVQDFAGNDLYLIDDGRVDIEDSAGALDTVRAWVDYTLGTGIETLELRGLAVEGRGNDLANTITGNGKDNILAGAGGSDTIVAGAGNDTLSGGSGSESLSGGDGDDMLQGGLGGDTLNGDSDSDILWGGQSADRLFGGDGEDMLVGGGGTDTLYGGTDVDTFVFRVLSDSRAGATRDIISGFEAGLDLVDLKGVDANSVVTGNQAFAFIGTAAFGNVAGQLRLVSGVNSVLQGDLNGDGVADFEVQFNVLTTINVNDLLL